jgi:predicted transcriptional regulator of viral defense system
MDFTEFKNKLRSLPVISRCDLAALKEDNQALRNQLVRWQKKKLLIQLKRGLYMFNENERRITPSESFIANRLYEPSYVSLEYALGYYGLIPERVAGITSISTRKTARFRNTLGTFTYQHIKPHAFRSFREEKDSTGLSFFIAEPEKALIDFFYLNLRRFNGFSQSVFKESFRFQNTESLKKSRILELAALYANNKLTRVAKVFCEYLKQEKRK